MMSMKDRLSVVTSTDTQPTKPFAKKTGPKVRILWFTDGGKTTLAEREIEELLADGWRIVAAGGGGDAPEEIDGRQMMYGMMGIGFIVLQKDAAE